MDPEFFFGCRIRNLFFLTVGSVFFSRVNTDPCCFSGIWSGSNLSWGGRIRPFFMNRIRILVIFCKWIRFPGCCIHSFGSVFFSRVILRSLLFFEDLIRIQSFLRVGSGFFSGGESGSWSVIATGSASLVAVHSFLESGFWPRIVYPSGRFIAIIPGNSNCRFGFCFFLAQVGPGSPFPHFFFLNKG